MISIADIRKGMTLEMTDGMGEFIRGDRVIVEECVWLTSRGVYALTLVGKEGIIDHFSIDRDESIAAIEV